MVPLVHQGKRCKTTIAGNPSPRGRSPPLVSLAKFPIAILKLQKDDRFRQSTQGHLASELG